MKDQGYLLPDGDWLRCYTSNTWDRWDGGVLFEGTGHFDRFYFTN